MGVEISENLTFLFNLSGGLSYREDDKKKIKKIYPTAGIPIEFYVLYVWGAYNRSIKKRLIAGKIKKTAYSRSNKKRLIAGKNFKKKNSL